jgi:hypothetical protein
MASKLKMAKFARGLPVPATTSVRRLLTKPTGLYLLALRSHVTQGQLLKRKVVINIQSEGGEDGAAKPIKIAYT